MGIMNRTLRFPLIALLTSIVVATTFVPPAHAANCANPQGAGEARACEKAAQGATELRRFVDRTRNIYQLSVWDFRTAPQPVAYDPRNNVRGAPVTVALSDN
jgi:hypothetical protein